MTYREPEKPRTDPPTPEENHKMGECPTCATMLSKRRRPSKLLFDEGEWAFG